MKKSLLILGGVASLTMLAGCSGPSIFSELPALSSVKEAILELPIGETKLADVKDASGLQEDLPESLSTITIGGEALDCQVTHLVIVDRNTNTTRQTDRVVCRVLLEGDGICADFECTMDYTYTQNGGWGLSDWELLTDQVSITIDDGVLINQLARMNAEDLEEKYGEDTVTYVSGEWDPTTQICSQTFQVDGSSGLMVTVGSVEIDQVLTLDLNKGLCYSWETTTDEENVIRGADLENTTWIGSGTVDSTQAAIAFYVEEFDLEGGTAVVTVAAEQTPEGGYLSRKYARSQTVTWEAQEDGTVILSLTVGKNSWDCCFSEEKQWVRMNGSYLNSLTETVMPEDDDLVSLLEEQEEVSDEEDLGYSPTKTGQSYSASDGTTVYVQQVSYPVFTGTDAKLLNQTVTEAIGEFLDQPNLSTTTADLDALEATAQEKKQSLPITDEMTISVEFNKNKYLSMLYTIIRCDSQTGKKTYRYYADIFDLETGEKLEYGDFFTATSREIGALLVENGGSSFPYTSSSAASYIVAATLGRQGMEFYLSTNAQEATKVTIPYSESVCTLNPTVKRAEDSDTTITSTTGTIGTAGTTGTTGTTGGSQYSQYSTGTRGE